MVNELLFKKAVKGDKDWFLQLIEPIKEKLYRIAFVYLKNEDDALDCIHDGIIKAIKSAVAFPNEGGKMNNDYKQITEEFIIQIK